MTHHTAASQPSRRRFIVFLGLVMGASLVSGFYATALFAADTSASTTPPKLFPATPHEFTQLYAAASASLSSEAVASFYSAEVRSIPFQGESYIMMGQAKQQELLAGFFDGLAARKISALTLSDYAITQISDHFAITRLRWDLSGADGTNVRTINSTYVIRLEDTGWRVVTILEMGQPHGP